MRKPIALAAVLAFATAGAAFAQTADPIATRKAGQDLLSGDFAGIRAVVELKGDIKKLESPAKALSAWMKVFPNQFPPGSDKGETKALPAVWSDNAGFRKAADDFIAAADKLVELTKTGDAAAVAPQLKVVGEACLACHKTYRQR